MCQISCVRCKGSFPMQQLVFFLLHSLEEGVCGKASVDEQERDDKDSRLEKIGENPSTLPTLAHIWRAVDFLGPYFSRDRSPHFRFSQAS